MAACQACPLRGTNQENFTSRPSRKYSGGSDALVVVTSIVTINIIIVIHHYPMRHSASPSNKERCHTARRLSIYLSMRKPPRRSTATGRRSRGCGGGTRCSMVQLQLQLIYSRAFYLVFTTAVLPQTALKQFFILIN